MDLSIRILDAGHNFGHELGLDELVVHLSQDVLSLVKGEQLQLGGAVEALDIQRDYGLSQLVQIYYFFKQSDVVHQQIQAVGSDLLPLDHLLEPRPNVV